MSTSVSVVGAINGATVQLLGNGAPIGSPAVASGLSVSVPIAGATLTPGMQISAIQSVGADASVPYPFPETVNAAPSPLTGLPSVVFLTGVHPCVDWILIGGLIPGATVEVYDQGNRVGSALASGAVVSVPVTLPGTASPNDTLEAFQTFTTPQGETIKGPAVASLPMGQRPPGEPPVPSVQQPFECDLAVLVSGLLEGVNLVVKQGTQEVAGYPFVGTPVWAELVTPVRLTDLMSARQIFHQCGAASPFSPPVATSQALKLPTPVIVGPVCPNAPLVRVHNLRPGLEVVVWADKVTASGGGSGVVVGRARAWATDCEFALPADWGNSLISQPGQLMIKVWQEGCGKGSDPVSLPVEPLPGAVTQPAIQSPIECARLIAARALTPGAYVIVTSDQQDWPQLSGPIRVSAPAMPLGLNRPLRAHEHVVVRQAGCNAGADSASTEVAVLGDIRPPVVESPVRIPQGGVGLRHLVIGARVHVFVEGMDKASFDAAATEQFVPVAGLTREARIWARQVLCTRASAESNHESATLGRITVSHEPATITRTTATTITVRATDADSGQPVNGNVIIGGAIAGATNAAFPFTFPAGLPPASFVDAAGYQPETIFWKLTDPAPEHQPDPAPVQTAMLRLSVTNQAPALYKIASVAWSVERQELNGTFTLVASPAGESVAVQPPTVGQYHIYAAVSVDDLVYGGTVLAEFRGNAVVHGLSTLVIVWNKADLAHAFRLTAETQTVFAGGTAYQIVNPVVLS